jgi:hypothetical protein
MPGKSRAQLIEEAEASERGQDLQNQYHPAFAARVRDACLLGATNDELAAILGVSVQSIQTWLVEIPRFRRAVALGREVADERVARALYRRATGMKVRKEKAFNVAGELQTIEITEHLAPDVTAAGLWLSNRQRGKWRSASAGDPAATGFDLGAFVGALAQQLAKPAAQPGDDAAPVKPLDVVTVNREKDE